MFLSLIQVKSKLLKPLEITLMKKNIWIGFFIATGLILASLASGCLLLILNKKWSSVGFFLAIIPFIGLIFLLFKNPKLFFEILLIIPNLVFNILIVLPMSILRVFGSLAQSEFYFKSLNLTMKLNRFFILLTLIVLIVLILVFIFMAPKFKLGKKKVDALKTIIISTLIVAFLMFLYLTVINIQFNNGDTTNHY